MLKNLILLGAPGGGKGTIAKKMIKDFSFKHISAGDILRKHVHEKTKLGLEAKKFMDEGALVPDRIVVDLVLDEISRRGNNNVLLDGFPRTVNQAEVLNKSLHINVVVNLDVPHEVIMQRMANRWIHFPSGRTYAYDYNPPKTIGFDDVTNEPLSQREDDKPEVVKKRLVHYESATKPLIDYYQNLKNCDFSSFTGTESDVIYPQVFNYLKSKF